VVAAALVSAVAWAFVEPAGAAPRAEPSALAQLAQRAPLAPVASEAPPALRQVRITSPLPGQRIRAGSELDISWSFGSAASAALSSSGAGLEEWEAFLSLDDGRTYPLRITPHLDLAVRRFAWRVTPGLRGPARLLLRFGDERREWTFDPALIFEIEGDEEERHASSQPASERLSGRGESARPGDRGVIWWQDGSRDGSRLVVRTADRARPPTWEAPEASITASLGFAPLAPPAENSLLPPPHSGPSSYRDPPAWPRRAPPVGSGPSLRLRIHRFNE
jgi:hypothetical protein